MRLPLLVGLLFLFLIQPASAINVAACSNLSVAGATYDLTQNISTTATQCINFTAANIILDGHGFYVTGSNYTTDFAGIYSNKSNSTIKNINVRGFRLGIRMDANGGGNASNSSISNTSTDRQSTTTGAGVYFQNGVNLSLNGGTHTASSYGVIFDGCANSYATNFTAILNSAGTADAAAILIYNSRNIAISNASASSNVSRRVIGADVLAININFTNVSVSHTSTSSGYLLEVANNVGGNISIDCMGAAITGNVGKGIYGIDSNLTNTTITNCSISGFGTGIYLTAAKAGNSVVTLNNISTNVWINNANSTNVFNTSTQGNIYYFPNGTASWSVFNISSSTSSPWADRGTSRPFNATTVGGNWSGLGGDWFPYTLNIVSAAANYTNITAISVYPSTPTVLNNLSCNVTVQGIPNATYFVTVNWSRNGTFLVQYNYTGIANNTATLLGNLTAGGNFSKGDIMSCAAQAVGTNTSVWNTSADVTILNSNPVNATISSFTNSTNSHQFNVSAYADDADGGSDITGWNWTITSGTCANASNSASGNRRYANLTCTGTALQSATINLTFIDSSGAFNSTIGSNAYPNNAPTAPSSLLPDGGENFTGAASNSVSINWTNSTDADSDSIVYWLYYSSDGGSAYTFITNTTSNPYTWDSSATASGSGYRVRVYANDSYNTSSNISSTSNFTIQHNTAPAIAANLSFTNATAGHWFYANATAADADGGTDITSWNLTTTAGSCANYSNSTSGNNHTVVYNCTTTSPATTTINITFIDSGGLFNSTTGSNTYPDHAASLGAPSITPNPALTTSNPLTCNAGAFSDVDSDTEDTAARTWRWFNGTALISGQTANTLANSSFVVGDVISCEERATNSTWPSSNATANSSGVVITNNPPPTIVMTYPANSSSFLGINGTCSFLAIANITFQNGTTNRSISASLYLDGIFQESMTATPTGDNGTYNFNFTGITQGGVYNVSVAASDSNGAATNRSAWATYGRMGGCAAAGSTDSTEYPFIALVIMAFTFIYFMGHWDLLNPFLAPLSNFLAILGLMSLSVAFLIIVKLTPSGAYDTAFMAAVYTFVALGFYLGLRMVVMAWMTLKAVLWK